MATQAASPAGGASLRSNEPLQLYEDTVSRALDPAVLQFYNIEKISFSSKMNLIARLRPTEDSGPYPRPQRSLSLHSIA
jgi:hypothetical protein